MPNQKPLISVLVCNYNYANFIGECFESIRLQSYSDIEIVIIDDGSSDNSAEVIGAFVDKNPLLSTQVLIKKKNEGICYARNDAIEMAKGEYFIFLDSDDTIPADYVAKMYKTAKSEGADVTYGDFKKFGGETAVSTQIEYDSKKLLLYNYINIATLVKKASIENHRFDAKLNRKTLEDYDFWLGLSLKGCIFTKSHDSYLNYRIKNTSRNDNIKSKKDQELTFIDVWGYIIRKYRLMYPDKINESVYLWQIDRYINNLGGHVEDLNHEIQDVLLPEMTKRQMHIRNQEDQIKHLTKKVHLLESRINELLVSREYTLGGRVLKVPRKIKNTIRKK